jgi:transposase
VATLPSGEHASWLLTLVAEQPDLTLDEVVSAMHKHRIAGSRNAVWRFFDRYKIPFIKILRAAEQERANVARVRRCWKREQGMLSSRRLVFIDEIAANTKMMRLSDRYSRGERLVGRVPHGHRKTITFVAALRRNGMTAPFVVDGSMTGKTFLAFVQQCLVPTLKRKDIVIMDKPPTQKAPARQEVIEAADATLRYLPQFLPDLNPIEMSFSKLEAFLRKLAERTVSRLCRWIGSFARTLSARETRNYFRHAGYT